MHSRTTATSFDFQNQGLVEVLFHGPDDGLARLGAILFALVAQDLQVVLLMAGDALLRLCRLELGDLLRGDDDSGHVTGPLLFPRLHAQVHLFVQHRLHCRARFLVVLKSGTGWKRGGAGEMG